MNAYAYQFITHHVPHSTHTAVMINTVGNLESKKDIFITITNDAIDWLLLSTLQE